MKQMLTYWSFDLSSIAFFASVVLFIIVSKSYSNRKYILSILFLLIVCLFSPLQILASHYLFSAHMTVHVLLLLCVGPLLIANLPVNAKQFQLLFSFLKRHSIVSWLIGIGTMWFWHIPIVFNSAMSQTQHGGFNVVSIAETSSLVFAGMLFSVPIIHTNKEFRIDRLSGVIYLFTACIGCSLLGLLITFAPAGIYHHFLYMRDEFGFNKLITQNLGITKSMDQQAAGLIMWVPCCLIYVTGAMYLLVQWFQQKEEVIAYSKEV